MQGRIVIGGAEDMSVLSTAVMKAFSARWWLIGLLPTFEIQEMAVVRHRADVAVATGAVTQDRIPGRAFFDDVDAHGACPFDLADDIVNSSAC